MKTNSLLSIISVAFTVILAACDGGGGGSTPTTTAKVGFSKGVITAKGSITVNGVKFNSSSADVKFDNLSGAGIDDSKLKVGMVVKIKGKIDDASKTGIAEKIEFTDNFQGPIDSVNLVTGTFTVFGQTVLIDANTVFEGSSGLTGLTPLVVGNVVEVSGFPDAAGVILATRIENKTNSGESFEVKGTISNITGNTFILTPPGSGTALTVTMAVGATLPVGVDNGSFVEVRVTGSGTIVTATKVELESELEAEDNDRLEVEGIVTSVDTPNATFVVNGITVNAAGMTLPAAGQKIEVEGQLVNGVLVPASSSSIKVEQECNIEIKANVTAVNGNSLTTLGSLTGFVTADTIFKDNSSAQLVNFSLTDIKVGDHLEITAFANPDPANPDTGIISKIERKNPSSEIALKGPINFSTPSAGTFILLGLTIDTNGAGVQFKSNIVTITSTAFYAALTPDKTIVKAKGTAFDTAAKTLTATEVEIKKQLP